MLFGATYCGRSTRLKTATAVSLLICASLVSAYAAATEYSRSANVLRMTAVAANRPVSAGSQNIIRMYFSPEPWGTSSCRQDAADISPGDWHLYSLALHAWRTNKTVVVLVDDSLRLDTTDVVCQATAINVL